MNMSIQDGVYKSFGPGASETNDRRAYNLGWKFSAVLHVGRQPIHYLYTVHRTCEGLPPASVSCPGQIHEVLRSDGQFRILVFAGDVSEPTYFDRLDELGNYLSSETSFLRRVTPFGDPIDAPVEVLTIHTAHRFKVEVFDLHRVFHH